MTIVVEKTDAGWIRFAGHARSLPVQMFTCTIMYADGRVETDKPCPPYVTQHQVSPGKVQQLVADGIWGPHDLVPYGLKVAVEFVVPDGTQRVGDEAFVERNGVVSQVYQTEKIASKPEPVEPSADERMDQLLADYRLTREQMKRSIFGESIE